MAKDESTFALMKSYGAGILAAIILALLIRFFVIEAYRIPNDVMHPTLERGDIIFVSKMAYGLRHPTNSRKLTQGTRPKYGDVVTYFTQEDPFRHYIKRIVGLPGDTIELLNGQLILNGKKVKYSFLPGSNCGFEHHPSAEYRVCIEPPYIDNFGPTKLKEDQIWVVGDYRKKGISNQPWNLVQLDDIYTRAKWIWLSIELDHEESIFPKFHFDRIFRRIE